MTSIYKPLGDLVQLVDERNKDLTVKMNLGLSISKEFIPTVGNTVGTNMANYKVIKKNQFACSLMQVRRDKKMPVALLRQFDQVIISPAYPVFKVIDEEVLLPEYLMMWFSREEFDRHACFLAVGGVRGSLEWDDFMEMELPVPSIEKQRAIVKEYQTVTHRIKLNEQLNQKLEETAQALYKHWFERVTDDVANDIYLKDLVDQSKETLNPLKSNFDVLEHYSLPSYDETGLPTVENTNAIRSNKYKVVSNSILLSKLNPRFSRVWNIYGLANDNAVCSTEFLVFVPKDIDHFSYLYFTLKSENSIKYFSSMATGTSNSHQRIKPDEILQLPILNYSKNKAFEFSKKTVPFLKRVRLNLNEIVTLTELRSIILSQMSKIDSPDTEWNSLKHN